MRFVVPALLVLAGCAPSQPPALPSPESTALSVFALPDEPEAARLLELFDVDAEDRRRAALLETLDALPSEPLRVTRADPTDDGFWVEIEHEPESGEAQSFVVELETTGPTSWRIVWLAGPESSWPRRSLPRRYTGLTVSAGPDGK